MRYINHNPSNKKTVDCVVRAIAGASGKSWEEVFDGLVVHARRIHTMPNGKECYEAYLKEIGYTKHSIPKAKRGEKRMTAKQLAERADAIIQQANHFVYSKEGHVVDIWNSENRTVYSYYTKD